jgi:hypothetical protein
MGGANGAGPMTGSAKLIAILKCRRSKAMGFTEGVEFIETVPIAASDRRKISFGNATALYKR